MRFEKFTTKLQEALAEAQSLALGKDQQYIEPEHLLLALLSQADGGASGLLAKAGGNVNKLKQELEQAVGRFPVVE
ncbi:MAG TPA: Clp protease N-terminal domain-containing protein, partial [Burkholderiales bacterium]|nr:Clp protease N-terminal domain-containing protein [Burkholderiales bacterium]